jgi:type II secretory pathway pseudopilin PulG
VVIGVIAVLVGLMLPALARSREQAQALACLSNLRQLTLAWMSYATDNRGLLPGAETTREWDWVRQGLAGSEELRQGVLWKYARSEGVYRCPSEWREGYRYSYAIVTSAGDTGGRGKLGQIRFSDRQAVFIEDSDLRGAILGSFAMRGDDPETAEDEAAWIDVPGRLHRAGRLGSVTLSFADGHAERKRFEDERTVQLGPVGDAYPTVRHEGSRDLAWMSSVFSPKR